MKSFLITGIDDDLYKEFKAACAFYGLTIRGLFIKHMKCIVSDYRVHKAPEKEELDRAKKENKEQCHSQPHI